jgi:predicted nucleic acid-binding protein
MHKTIVSDTSCLILLRNIDELNILEKLYGEVIITSIIEKEYKYSLPSWIKVIDPKNKDYQNELEKTIDKGEASAIALAIELSDCKLIVDDGKARKKAYELGLDFTGTIGVLRKAKEEGLIKELKPLFDKIVLTNFYITSVHLNQILKEEGE